MSSNVSIYIKNKAFISKRVIFRFLPNKFVEKLLLFLFPPWFFIVLLKVFRWFPKIENCIVSKWHYSLDDKNVCHACSVKVKFYIDLGFSETKKLECKNSHAYSQRKNKQKPERVHEWNFENYRNFPRIFQFE